MIYLSDEIQALLDQGKAVRNKEGFYVIRPRYLLTVDALSGQITRYVHPDESQEGNQNDWEETSDTAGLNSD